MPKTGIWSLTSTVLNQRADMFDPKVNNVNTWRIAVNDLTRIFGRREEYAIERDLEMITATCFCKDIVEVLGFKVFGSFCYFTTPSTVHPFSNLDWFFFNIPLFYGHRLVLKSSVARDQYWYINCDW